MPIMDGKFTQNALVVYRAKPAYSVINGDVFNIPFTSPFLACYSSKLTFNDE